MGSVANQLFEMMKANAWNPDPGDPGGTVAKGSMNAAADAVVQPIFSIIRHCRQTPATALERWIASSACNSLKGEHWAAYYQDVKKPPDIGEMIRDEQRAEGDYNTCVCLVVNGGQKVSLNLFTICVVLSVMMACQLVLSLWWLNVKRKAARDRYTKKQENVEVDKEESLKRVNTELAMPVWNGNYEADVQPTAVSADINLKTHPPSYVVTVGRGFYNLEGKAATPVTGKIIERIHSDDIDRLVDNDANDYTHLDLGVVTTKCSG